MNYFQRLQRSIDFIETNLTEAISLTEVAEESYCSLYHFHRLFQIMVGNSAKEYIRKRRLTFAAKALVETKKAVIDIAYDYQYGTPESFSRAFKKMYGLSPLEYRKWGVFLPLNEKADLLSIYNEEKRRGITMKPVIQEKDEFHVVGIELNTQLDSCQRDVPQFWKGFSQKHALEGLQHLKSPNEIFGICFGSCNGRCNETASTEEAKNDESNFNYLVCSEVESLEDIPDGFIYKTFPKARYAVFTLKGGYQDLQKGVASIYKNWLSNTSYKLAHLPHFEKYDERWTGQSDSEMEIWIPIK